jgi:hypothetical protein
VAGPGLDTNLPASTHRTAHNLIHTIANEFDLAIGSGANQSILAMNTATGLYEPTSIWALLPAGTTITMTKAAGVWPGAPTTRADIVIIWKGPDPSPASAASRTLGVAEMLNNVDMRAITT